MAKLNSTILIGIVIATFAGLVDSAVKLHVSSDQPAILGSSITFYATLENRERDSYDISIVENAPPGRSQQGVLNASNNFKFNWTMSARRLGTYSVTTTVSYEVVFFFVTAATKVTYFEITDKFSGTVTADQPGRNPKVDPTYVLTTNETQLHANVHDPTSYLKTAVNVTYTWSQNGTFIANTTEPLLIRNFTQEGVFPIQVNLTAIFPNTTAANTTTYFERYGSFNLNVTARIPIVNFTYSGTTWFRHGKLLELHVTCDGSSMYNYCWMMKPGGYNHTGNETCGSPSETNDCDFQIMRYIPDPGIYTLLIIIGNDVSHLVNQSTVNIYKVNRQPQFSVIIVPISCTILAIALVIFGVAYWWENRERYTVETADFDFGQSDEERPYTRFFDRLRDSLYANSRSSHNLLINPDEASQSAFTR